MWWVIALRLLGTSLLFGIVNLDGDEKFLINFCLRMEFSLKVAGTSIVDCFGSHSAAWHFEHEIVSSEKLSESSSRWVSAVMSGQHCPFTQRFVIKKLTNVKFHATRPEPWRARGAEHKIAKSISDGGVESRVKAENMKKSEAGKWVRARQSGVQNENWFRFEKTIFLALLSLYSCLLFPLLASKY